MTRRKIADKNIRKVFKSGSSYAITLPLELIQEFGHNLTRPGCIFRAVVVVAVHAAVDNRLCHGLAAMAAHLARVTVNLDRVVRSLRNRQAAVETFTRWLSHG